MSSVTAKRITGDHLDKPFGVAFYPPGPHPQYLYVANTGDIIRFPYRNGDLKARGPAEKLSAQLSSGGFLRGGGHWTRALVFSPDGKKMFAPSARARMTATTPRKPIARASSNSIPTGAGERFTRGEFVMRSASPFVPARTSFG
jgi:glucose/arabinose dehydrogenase